MNDNLDVLASKGLGTSALAENLRGDSYEPSHGNGNLPDDEWLASQEEAAERQDLIGTNVTIIGDVPAEILIEEEKNELIVLREKLAATERALEGAVIENQMFRRFHASIDDTDRHLFMQSVIFLASTAIDFKMDEERLQEFFNGKGECLHPAEEIADTGFGVTICRACKKHVEPAPEHICAHEDVVFYGTVGKGQCKDCGDMIPREAFTRDDVVKGVVEAVGKSIPKGQPVLNPGLAPRELPSAV
jgi:hypothetical protein